MAEPVVAQVAPFETTMGAGREYGRYAYGRSAAQTFRDGSHKGTGLSPVIIAAGTSTTVWSRRCEDTGSPSWCDGTHISLA